MEGLNVVTSVMLESAAETCFLDPLDISESHPPPHTHKKKYTQYMYVNIVMALNENKKEGTSVL